MSRYAAAMNLTIHVEGHADCAENIHVFITRGGCPEERMTRAEFRALVETLYCHRLTQVQPTEKLSLDVYTPTQS